VKTQQKTIAEVEGLTSIVVTPNTQKVILKGQVDLEELVVQAFGITSRKRRSCMPATFQNFLKTNATSFGQT